MLRSLTIDVPIFGYLEATVPGRGLYLEEFMTSGWLSSIRFRVSSKSLSDSDGNPVIMSVAIVISVVHSERDIRNLMNATEKILESDILKEKKD